MTPFEYVRATSVADATEAARAPGAAYLAAGTNLLDLMKGRVLRPTRLVDVTRIPELAGWSELEDGSWRIGALVRNADLAADARFAACFPAIAEALLAGASAQLRNAATAGGNVLQATRCAYFTDATSACNRREEGAGCAAIGGETRRHAVLGWTQRCIATHPSDFAVGLAAFDATVEIAGPDGTQRVETLERLLPLPDETAARPYGLAPGELVLAVRLPPGGRAFAAHARYIKLRNRTSYAFAIVSGVAALRLEGGRIAAARLALGGVAARPWRAAAAEAFLAGRTPDAASFREAAALALADARPSGDNATKIELARRLAGRVLAAAAAGTPVRMPALPGSVFASPPASSTGASAYV